MMVNKVTPDAITAEPGFNGKAGPFMIAATFDVVEGVVAAINLGEHFRYRIRGETYVTSEQVGRAATE
jgi:hypothetical protein